MVCCIVDKILAHLLCWLFVFVVVCCLLMVVGGEEKIHRFQKINKQNILSRDTTEKWVVGSKSWGGTKRTAPRDASASEKEQKKHKRQTTHATHNAKTAAIACFHRDDHHHSSRCCFDLNKQHSS